MKEIIIHIPDQTLKSFTKKRNNEMSKKWINKNKRFFY